MIDLIGGQLHFLFASAPTAAPQMRAGKIKAYAVTGATRLAGLGDVPALRELGLKDFDASVWFGLVGPAGLPKDFVQRVNTRVSRAMNTREQVERLIDFGAEVTTNTPEQFATWIRSEMVKWAKAVKDSGARVDNN